MISIVMMTGKAYATESVETVADLHFDADETTRLDIFIEEGDAVILVDEVDSFKACFPGVEVIMVDEGVEDAVQTNET